jgi:hypothetical protein
MIRGVALPDNTSLIQGSHIVRVPCTTARLASMGAAVLLWRGTGQASINNGWLQQPQLFSCTGKLILSATLKEISISSLQRSSKKSNTRIKRYVLGYSKTSHINLIFRPDGLGTPLSADTLDKQRVM